ADPAEETPESPSITGYQSITDDTGVLTVDVPNEWVDVQTAPFTLEDGGQAPLIMASPSIDEFNASYLTPGMFFTALGPVSSLDETLAAFAPGPGECTDLGIQDYSDAAYTGRYQTFGECGGTGTLYVTVAAVPPDNSYTAIVVMQLVSDADLAVLDQVFATFLVTPA
ncbi:MAG TPA: hypothetical protein VFV63_09755, partial [Ilumatobacteraceae bacterium]|nr:hypothetical protein [Ilumatobacteraceae bacterium]